MADELIPGLVAFLRGDGSTLAASGGQIVQDFLPDGISQGISFLVLADVPKPSFNGSGRRRMRVQFSFNAPTASAQNAMSQAVYNLLTGYQVGQLSNVTSIFYVTARGGRSEATLQHAATADYYFFLNS
jgi:hypothetical protein